MKKLLCALIVCALCIGMLSGCGRRSTLANPVQSSQPAGTNPEVTLVPEEGSHGEQDQSQALAEMPTLPPAEPLENPDGGDDDDDYVDDDYVDDDYVDDDYVDDDADGDEYYNLDALMNASEGGDDSGVEALEASQAPGQRPGSNVIDPNTLRYSALGDPDMKLTFNYPSDWVNVPGVYTICYREMVEPDDYPARVAITAKLLVHSPEGTVLTDELTAFVRTIRKQYDSNTFQLGTLNTEDIFLGKQAYSNTYLAYSGNTEVKGFVIGCAIGRVL